MSDKEVERAIATSAYNTLRAQKPWRHPNTGIFHHNVLPSASLAPWLSDSRFMSLYEKISTHTLVDIYRCYELWSLAEQVADVDGDILEVGVWRGGTGAVLAEAIKHKVEKKVFLADTFAGVVKAGKIDTKYKGGEHADTSIEIVRELLASLSLTNTNLLPGIFPEDTQHYVQGKISMLHCDVDVYLSAKDVVEWCLPRLSVGSTLIFDDYGFWGCDGIMTFCHEFRQRKNFRFIHNLNGHAIFIKMA